MREEYKESVDGGGGMKEHEGPCTKVKRYDVMVCDRGCDYREARDAERRHAEKVTGMKFGEPFFVMQGLQLIATGGETPEVLLRAGNHQQIL